MMPTRRFGMLIHRTVEDFKQVANPGNYQLVVLERQLNGEYRFATELRRHKVAHAFQRPLALSAPVQLAPQILSE